MYKESHEKRFNLNLFPAQNGSSSGHHFITKKKMQSQLFGTTSDWCLCVNSKQSASLSLHLLLAHAKHRIGPTHTKKKKKTGAACSWDRNRKRSREVWWCFYVRLYVRSNHSWIDGQHANKRTTRSHRRQVPLGGAPRHMGKEQVEMRHVAKIQTRGTARINIYVPHLFIVQKKKNYTYKKLNLQNFFFKTNFLFLFLCYCYI